MSDDERILIDARQLLKLATSQNFKHVNARAIAVPDMSRVELLHSEHPWAERACEWLRQSDVRILSTVAFEDYYHPALDGKRTPDLLNEYSKRATRELIDKRKKWQSNT